MSLPARKLKQRYTWDDYRSWPDDERWEIIDGDAYAMSPSPSFRHQCTVVNLTAKFARLFRNQPCTPVVAPMDVKLSEEDVVQPDLMVVCRPEQRKRTHIEGAPALIVEILSETSVSHDRAVKSELYAAHGVREYWLVTPDAGLIEVLLLDGKRYRLHAVYRKHQTLTSPSFPKLKFNLRPIFTFPAEAPD